jgi:hypothetical protein
VAWNSSRRILGRPWPGQTDIPEEPWLLIPVVAGKMAESRLLMDGLSMMRQLGVIPAQAAIT